MILLDLSTLGRGLENGIMTLKDSNSAHVNSFALKTLSSSVNLPSASALHEPTAEPVKHGF